MRIRQAQIIQTRFQPRIWYSSQIGKLAFNIHDYRLLVPEYIQGSENITMGKKLNFAKIL